MRFLAALLALAPLAASAQSIDLTVRQRANVTVGPSDCGTRLRADWSLPVAVIPCDKMQFWFTDRSTCENQPGPNQPVIETVPSPFQSSTGTFEISVNDDLPVFNASDGGVTCGAATTATFKLCGSYPWNIQSCGFGSDTFAKVNVPPEITYDGVAPAVPTIRNVEPLDGSLAVAVDHDDDTATITVTATGATPDDVHTGEVATPQDVVTVEGLTNGVTYTVTAHATDAAGNVSGESAPATGAPTATGGFFFRCKEAGGCQETGCSATGATGPLVFLLLAGGFIILRRRAVR